MFNLAGASEAQPNLGHQPGRAGVPNDRRERHRLGGARVTTRLLVQGGEALSKTEKRAANNRRRGELNIVAGTTQPSTT